MPQFYSFIVVVLAGRQPLEAVTTYNAVGAEKFRSEAAISGTRVEGEQPTALHPHWLPAYPTTVLCTANV
jgi:hypothetical protein